jgi:hypothetical protein
MNGHTFRLLDYTGVQSNELSVDVPSKAITVRGGTSSVLTSIN